MRVVFLTKLYFTNGIYLQRKQIASKNNYNKLNFSLYYFFFLVGLFIKLYSHMASLPF